MPFALTIKKIRKLSAKFLEQFDDLYLVLEFRLFANERYRAKKGRDPKKELSDDKVRELIRESVSLYLKLREKVESGDLTVQDFGRKRSVNGIDNVGFILRKFKQGKYATIEAKENAAQKEEAVQKKTKKRRKLRNVKVVSKLRKEYEQQIKQKKSQ